MQNGALPLNERDLQRFFDRTPDLVCAQQGGLIIYTNAAFVRAMRGRDAQSFIGRQIVSLIAPEARERIVAQLRDRDPEVTRKPSDVRCLREDGSEGVLEYSSMRLGDPTRPISIIVARDVTGQRELNEALRRADAEFRLLFESAPIAIAQTDTSGRYLRANRAMCELTGYSDDELFERTYLDLTAPDDRAPDMNAVRALQQGLPGVKTRKRWVKKNGEVITVSIHVSVIRNAVGVSEGYLAHMADVTRELEKSTALKLAEEQFRTIFASAPIGMGMTALGAGRGYFQKVNRAMCELLGYSEEEMLSLPLTTFTDPIDQASDVGQLRIEELRAGEQQMTLKRYRGKTGKRIDAERFLSIVGDAEGNPSALVIQIIDVTVRRAMQEALRASEELHRTLVKNLPNVAVLTFDHELRYTLVDGEKLLSGIGLDASRLLGRLVSEVAMSDVARRIEGIYRRALSGEVVRWEHRRDGHIYDCHTNPLRNDSGEIIGGMTLLYETSAHWNLQRQLADSEARMASLLESTGDAMWSLDREGRVTVFNHKFAEEMKRTYGKEVELGMSLFEILAEPARSHTMENHRRVLQGESITFEWSELVEGKLQYMLISHSPIISAGEISGAALSTKDITTRRMMELAGERQKQIVELLHSIAATANESTTSDNAIAHSLALVAEFVGWSIGHAFRVVAGELVSSRNWYESDLSRFKEFRIESEKVRFAAGVGLPGRVLATKRAAWMASLKGNDQFMRAEVAGRHGLVSGFAFPILVGDEVAAVMEFFSERDEEPSDEVIEMMRNVGIQLGRVIERERHASEVRELSLTDELTGLHNRRGFMALGAQAVRASARQKRVSTVLFADLDGLKRINDTLGHEAGDLALKTFALLLRQTFRDGDIISRFGGDEFVVLLETPASAGHLAIDRLRQHLDKHNAANPGTPRLAASVGFVEMKADNSESLEALVARADAMMYENKKVRRVARESNPGRSAPAASPPPIPAGSQSPPEDPIAQLLPTPRAQRG